MTSGMSLQTHSVTTRLPHRYTTRQKGSNEDEDEDEERPERMENTHTHTHNTHGADDVNEADCVCEKWSLKSSGWAGCCVAACVGVCADR